MNQGHWIRALLFSVTAVTTDRGAIQSARASLIVVPTANAVGPYFDYRTGVVNRQRGPQSKLRPAHMHSQSNHRKQQKRRGIQDKNSPQ